MLLLLPNTWKCVQDIAYVTGLIMTPLRFSLTPPTSKILTHPSTSMEYSVTRPY